MLKIITITLIVFIEITTLFGQNNWSIPTHIGYSWNASPPILENVNGFPAIVHRSNGQDIMFVRALDSCGDMWDPPTNVSSLYISGINSTGDPHFKIVDGHPAITFHDTTNGNLIYCRADDANGVNWTQFKIIDSGSRVGKISKLSVVNGNPAIVYSIQDPNYGGCTGNIKYIRSADTMGNTWGTPQVIVSDQCNYWSANELYFEILNGHPALACRFNDSNPTGSPSGGYFTRANDVNGMSWPIPVSVANSGICNGLTIVDNKPCVLMYNSSEVGTATSLDTLGASWSGSLDMIDLGNSNIRSFGMAINQFNDKIYVTATNDDPSLDSLLFVESSNSLPLSFGTKELIHETSSFFSESDMNGVCGELSVVFLSGSYEYTRSISPTLYFEDFDNDGFGNNTVSMMSNTPIAGYVTDNSDCDDTDPNITIPGTICDDGISCTMGTTLQLDCSCGSPTTVNSVSNTFIGSNDNWIDPQNWSLNEIPDICHDVIIPSGKSVKIYNGDIGVCYTLNVAISSDFLVESGAQVSIVVP